MGLLSTVKDIFKPAAELIDNVHTSSEEKLTLRNELSKIEAQATMKILELQGELVSAQASIIVAEAKSDSYLARNWRPISSLVLLIIVIVGSFGGLMSEEIAQAAWTTFQICIGGYIAGRSVEKTAEKIKFKGKV